MRLVGHITPPPYRGAAHLRQSARLLVSQFSEPEGVAPCGSGCDISSSE